MRAVRNLASLSIVLLFLLMIVSAVPGGGAQPAERGTDTSALVLEDPVDDMQFGGMVPLPSTANTYDRADVRALTIGDEEPDRFDVSWRFEGRDAVKQLATEAVAFPYFLVCSVAFSFDGQDGTVYRLEVRDDRIWTEPKPPRLLSWLYRQAEDAEEATEVEEAVEAVWEPETYTIRLTVHKHALAPDGGDPPALGDVMQIDTAHCYTTIMMFGMYDRVDVANATYTIKTPGPGDMVSMVLGDPDAYGAFDFIGISKGPPMTVPVTLHNDDAVDRVVRLTPSVHDEAGPRPDWDLTLASRLSVPAGTTRTASLLVGVPPDAGSGAMVRLQVDMEVVGADAPGAVQRYLRVQPVFGPEQGTLNLHVQTTTFHNRDPVGTPIDGTWRRVDEARLSLLGDEPGWVREPFWVTPEWHQDAPLVLGPLTRDTALDPDGESTLHLETTAERPVEVRLRLTLYDEEVGTVLEVDGRVDASVPVHLVTPLADGAPRMLPAGTTLMGRLSITNPADGATAPTQVGVDVASSWLRLPATTASGPEVAITDGRFFPHVSLGAGEQAEVYVNPNKATTWEMVLANDGVETDDLRVTLDLENATERGWSGSVEPGRAFRVPAGNATPFGVTLRAPADAAEGDVVNVTVKAVSTHDAEASTTLRLRAIVTDGVAIEDETYGEKEGQLAPLAETEESSLGVSVFLASAVLGVAALRRRR